MESEERSWGGYGIDKEKGDVQGKWTGSYERMGEDKGDGLWNGWVLGDK